jgi:diacylglycerol kinase family enzyme
LLYAARALFTYRAFEARIASPMGSRTLRAVELRIVNGSFLGGIQVADDASVESEDISVQVIAGRSRWALVDTWLRQYLRRPLPEGRIVTLRASRFRIETDPPEPVSIDGEVLTQTPIDVSVSRQSLRVMVPRSRDDLD